jgi:hypothetical protein
MCLPKDPMKVAHVNRPLRCASAISARFIDG